MDCITGHGYVYHVRACEDRSWKCWCEAEDLAALLKDPFVQYLQLLGCGRYELAGVREARY